MKKGMAMETLGIETDARAVGAGAVATAPAGTGPQPLMRAPIVVILVLTIVGLCATLGAGIAEAADPVWTDLKPYIKGRGWANVTYPYWRLPDSQYVTCTVPAAIQMNSRSSAGLYAHFMTDVTSFDVRWSLTNMNYGLDGGWEHTPATNVSGIDLYARVPSGSWKWVANGCPTAQTTAVSFTGLPGAGTEYLLYLPTYNGVIYNATYKTEILLPPGALLPPPATTKKPIVIYGTSITQGAAASRPGLIYASQLGRLLDREVINLGFSGSGKLLGLDTNYANMAKLLAELEPELFVIDSMWNMNEYNSKTKAEFEAQVDPFIGYVRNTNPNNADTPIVVVGQPRYDGISTNINLWTSQICPGLNTKYGDIHFLNGVGLLGSDTEAATDGTHPDDLGMMRQAVAMKNFLEPLIGGGGGTTTWAVANVPGSETQRFYVDNGQIRVAHFNIYATYNGLPNNSHYSWNISDMSFSGDAMIGPWVANGTVLNGSYANPTWAAWGGDTGGWVGTAHKGELNVLANIAVDGGAPVAFSSSLNLSGTTVKVTKTSNAGPIDLTMEYTFPNTGDYFIEKHTYNVVRTTSGYGSMYAFMFCMATHIDYWIGIQGDGTEVEQNRTAITGDPPTYHPSLGELKAAIFWSSTKGKGLIYIYPQVYKGAGMKFNVVSRTDSTKFYFSADAKAPPTTSTYPVEIGNSFSFEVKVVPFVATAANWRDTGRTLVVSYGY